MQTPHVIFLLIVATSIIDCLAAPPAYYPAGPQTNVAETDLVGWTRCWSGTYDEGYNDNTNITRMFAACPGDFLLYGCRPVGASSLTLLAAGERSALLINTGNNLYDVTTNNGVDWYFNPAQSVGFAKQGDQIEKDSCDWIDGTYPDLKLCWHANGNSEEGSVSAGYRCGSAISFNNDWTREMWMQDPCINMNNGDACDDHNLCTSNDVCSEGVCTGVPCEQCMECDPTTGCVAVQDGASCSDDMLCTDNDTCQQGVCVGELITCDIPQGCQNSTCNALTGQCDDECAPIAPPVEAPITLGSEAPVEAPVMTPVNAPVDPPTTTGSAPPVVAPVAAPVASPVKAPTAKVSGSQNLFVFNGMLLAMVALLY